MDSDAARVEQLRAQLEMHDRLAAQACEIMERFDERLVCRFFLFCFVLFGLKFLIKFVNCLCLFWFAWTHTHTHTQHKQASLESAIKPLHRKANKLKLLQENLDLGVQKVSDVLDVFATAREVEQTLRDGYRGDADEVDFVLFVFVVNVVVLFYFYCYYL